MFTVDLDSAIQFLVENNRIQTEWETNLFRSNLGIISREAFYIKFEVDVRNFEYDESKPFVDECIRVPVHMIFFGNTSVFFFADKEKEFYGMPDPDRFENTSNHNSCWRSDGFRTLHQLYFDMCEEIAPNKAPKDLDPTCSFLNWCKMKKIWVKYKSKGGYGCNLLGIADTLEKLS